MLHRIQKDKQFLFVPGAMDYRRAEFDLRRVDPRESVLTVREYVLFLYELFTRYNLTANRQKRVDAHMAAEGVYPSPAGLWRWGHSVGIGVRRATAESDLIANLLPSGEGRVTRGSVRFAGNEYVSAVIEQQQWSTIARSHGGWNIPVHYYPGTVSRIWTPHESGSGLLPLTISDQAKTSAEVTYEEMLDAFTFAKMKRQEVEHQNTMIALESLHRMNALIRSASEQTTEAISKATGKAPNLTQARAMEVIGTAGFGKSEVQAPEIVRDEAVAMHQQMMNELLGAMNGDRRHHAPVQYAAALFSRGIPRLSATRHQREPDLRRFVAWPVEQVPVCEEAVANDRRTGGARSRSDRRSSALDRRAVGHDSSHRIGACR